MPFVNSNQNKPPEFVEVPTDLSISLSGSVAGGGQSPSQTDLRLKLGGTMGGGSAFVLTHPAPILTEVDPNAFTSQFYTARLLDGFGNEILIEKARSEKPVGGIGEIVSLTVGRKQLSEISVDKTYTFQIGKRGSVNGAPTWKTIVENGKLNGRQFSMAKRKNLPSDSLSFDTIETKKNRLNRIPYKNYIFYDRTRTEVEDAELERIYDSNGDYVETQKFGYNSLTIYKLFAFTAEKCGFAPFEPSHTNIPNFELVRADFGYRTSYRESLNGYIGMWKPMYKILPGNVLQIQTTLAPIPDGFEPVPLTIQNYSQISLQIAGSVDVSAIEVTYVDSNTQADYYVDTTEPPKRIENGERFDPGYSETTITQTYRRWYKNGQPNTVLDEKLIKEVHSTRGSDGFETDNETTEYKYDAQAKQTGQTQTVKSTVPDLNFDPPFASLQTVRETVQDVDWKSDPYNSRRQYPYAKKARTNALVAIDSENQALGANGELADYRQDFEKVYEHGNLTAAMSSEFAPLESEIETLTPIGNNQYLLRRGVRDLILNKMKNRFIEVVPGDATIKSVGGKTRKFTVWREGESLTGNSGGEIIDLSVGELPSEFFQPLANLILDRRINGFQTGTLVIPGWHESLDRGVFFRVFDREGNNLGRYVCEGVSTDFDRLSIAGEQTVITTVTISEV